MAVKRRVSKKGSKKRSSKKRMSCRKGSVKVKSHMRGSKRVARHCSKVGKRRSKKTMKRSSYRMDGGCGYGFVGIDE